MKIERLILKPLDNNCYILSKDDEAIIIDPSEEYEKIEKYINDNSLRINAIFVTHYHYDHIGSLEYFVNKYKPKIYDYKTIGKFKEARFKFKVIPTKGHSMDSVSFLFEDTNDMFVGDFVFEGSIGRMDLSGGSEEEMAYSLNMLRTFPKETKIYPGHGNITNLDKELRTNPYL